MIVIILMSIEENVILYNQIIGMQLVYVTYQNYTTLYQLRFITFFTPAGTQ